MTELAAELAAATAAMVTRFPVDLRTPATEADLTLWMALVDAGFTALDVPEPAGGQGAELGDALAVLDTLTEAGAITPYVEHALLAAWLAGRVDHVLDGLSATVAVVDEATVRGDDERIRLSGTAIGVPYAASADVIVILASTTDGAVIAVVDRREAGLRVEPGTDLMGLDYSDIVFDDAEVTFSASSPVTVDDLRTRGALVYAVTLAAAARAVRERTIRYAAERVQFGRPLTKFQAIQQRLAHMAAQSTMMETAARAATDAASEDIVTARDAIAAAKIVTSRSAHDVAAAAHQIHGAIGFTAEHSLGRFTTALWTWRDRYGTEHEWSEQLAARILDDGLDPWHVITGASDPVAQSTRTAAQ
ncbi:MULTISPECIES: acyl-CoA dehydrogenase family protein [Gordonia]|uniref:acyl-CoA dehydrogenase family protein n=1 Tax=Gordonia TaxID=2053 RepID=UPI00071D731C|nr:MULTISPECIES: acyl-CoA dehydrogenase family protein [unclassified Gordonia (in: high G+C Gram-positive bacteria)]KSU58766.1 acyl-CoA dehydrogenase [Gordonia sp. SGD-V-85]SCC13322.1 acyl-CoA dehydrogenase [Gordonia sp. v-85]